MTSEETLNAIRECAREGRVEFASQDRLSQYSALLHDFMEHIVHCDRYWLSDREPVMREFEASIQERYGVDIKLCEKDTYYFPDVMEKIATEIVDKFASVA